MRGHRISPRQIRNNNFTTWQARQALFIRSTNNMTREVRSQMRELTGKQIRELRPSSNPQPMRSKSESAQILENLADLLDEAMEKKDARDGISKAMKFSTSANRERYGLVAEGLGNPRDADGNVIHLDEKDRPYVYINNGEIIYVKVYKARITPKGTNLNAKCTIANPDGKEEVLLVEPIQVIGAPPAFSL